MVRINYCQFTFFYIFLKARCKFENKYKHTKEFNDPLSHRVVGLNFILSGNICYKCWRLEIAYGNFQETWEKWKEALNFVYYKLCKLLVSYRKFFSVSLLVGNVNSSYFQHWFSLVQVNAVTQADMCFGFLKSCAVHMKFTLPVTTDLELKPRAFACPFAHIPFILVGRTKECQGCSLNLLQVGASAQYICKKCRWSPMISLRARFCSPAINVSTPSGYSK